MQACAIPSGLDQRTFPLNVVLVSANLDEELRAELWHELHDLSAIVEADFGSVEMLIRELPDAGRPRLFIVPLLLPAHLEDVRAIQSRFPRSAIVGLVHSDDAPMILSATRSGVNQLVSIPLNGAELGAAMARTVPQTGAATRLGKVVAVCGASGGCGATMLAVNLAYEIARFPGKHCILSELAPVGSLGSYLWLRTQFNTEDLFNIGAGKLDLGTVEKALTKVTDTLEFLPGPDCTITPTRRAISSCAALLHHLRRLADVVVIDLPYTYDEAFFERLELADEVVLVAEQTVPSLRALQRLEAALRTSERLALTGIRSYCVINRFRDGQTDFSTEELTEQLGEPCLSFISNDYRAVSEALNAGRPMRMVQPKSPVLKDIVALARLVAPPQKVERAAHKETSRKSLFTGLRNWMRSMAS